jgi:hypothetical protein
VLTKEQIAAAHEMQLPLYRSHFATCPFYKREGKAKKVKEALKPYVGEPDSEFFGMTNGQLSALLDGRLENKRVVGDAIIVEPWPPGTFEAARLEIMDRQNRGHF